MTSRHALVGFSLPTKGVTNRRNTDGDTFDGFVTDIIEAVALEPDAAGCAYRSHTTYEPPTILEAYLQAITDPSTSDATVQVEIEPNKTETLGPNHLTVNNMDVNTPPTVPSSDIRLNKDRLKVVDFF